MSAPAASAHPEALESCVAADRRRSRERLRALVSRADVREAIFLASRSLEKSLDKWLSDPESERGQKTERSLIRYLARMAGRPTPFGLFAGITLGAIGERTLIELEPVTSYRRRSRFDMQYLYALSECLSQLPEVRVSLRYRVNSSLYRVGNLVRYAQAVRNGGMRSFSLVGIEDSEHLQRVLEKARDGASFSELMTDLAAYSGAEVEETEQFLNDLIESQVIVPELEPAVTGEGRTRGVLEQLAAHPRIRAPLAAAQEELAVIDETPLGIPPSRYGAVVAHLRQLPAEIEPDLPIQIDLVKPARTATLDPRVVSDVLKGALALYRLMPVESEQPLNRFREAFQARYEGAEVPLAEALDRELGIGFEEPDEVLLDASPLVDSLVFPEPASEEVLNWGAKENLLAHRIAEHAGEIEIRLSDADLAEMQGGRVGEFPLADSFTTTAMLYAESEGALAQGQYRVKINGMAGPSGAIWCARFGHAEPGLTDKLKELLRQEESLKPEAIFAEIAHMHDLRDGNILGRSVLRDHEIPLLGVSGAPHDRQLTLSDLMVSVVGPRIVLRSRRLGREVAPRLASAWNYKHTKLVSVVRFLTQLQRQGLKPYAIWDWGGLRYLPFQPRVVWGRVILSDARWLIRGEYLHPLTTGDPITRYRAVQQLRKTLRLPRFVGVVDHDNVLPVDLDNALSVDSFALSCKGWRGLELCEMVGWPDQLPSQGPEGAFYNELVVPFTRVPPADSEKVRPGDVASSVGSRSEAAPPPPVPAAAIESAVLPQMLQRNCPPGSEWLYAKLYMGRATVDQALQQVVAPLAARSMAMDAIDQWFFIRYGDPEWHLRVRFHGQAERLIGWVLPQLAAAIAPWIEDRRCHRVQLDTYQREVERYGGPNGITLCEAMFHQDSEATVSILAALEEAPADARGYAALLGADRLLGDLGFSTSERLGLVRACRESFAQRIQADVQLTRGLGEKFRRERKALFEVMELQGGADHPLSAAFAALGERSRCSAPFIAELRARDAAGLLGRPLLDLAASLIHMHINRVLRTAQAAHELVLYDFLARIYESRAALAGREVGSR
jgi:thiopeptide-type bacteriocin biosynthesis protein